MKKMTSAKKTALEIGAGLIATGAAAAGYYFYASKDAKKNRKIAAKWATDMKKEVEKEVKRLESTSPKAFAAVVDRIAKTYQIARSVDASDVKRAAQELKANWDTVQRETKKTVRKNVSGVKSAAKKITRKSVSKVKATVQKVTKKRTK